jgi:hypothetical protein
MNVSCRQGQSKDRGLSREVNLSVTSNGRRWENLHSLWIGWTFTLGFFNWIAFLYIGFRTRQLKWILWALFYLVPFILAMSYAAPDQWDTWLGSLTILLTIVQRVMLRYGG